MFQPCVYQNSWYNKSAVYLKWLPRRNEVLAFLVLRFVARTSSNVFSHMDFLWRSAGLANSQPTFSTEWFSLDARDSTCPVTLNFPDVLHFSHLVPLLMQNKAFEVLHLKVSLRILRMLW